MASSSHRPRKKRKLLPSFPPNNNLGDKSPAFPLVAFLWSARWATSPWVMLPLILIFVGLFRCAAGLWGFSGYRAPPVYGDFEAQRHWMELTIHLPTSMWYFYDLQWWGLDYPPLTAYHSWILGKLGSLFNQSWFALDTSRGLDDDPLLKVYMRATVIVSEYVIFIPAIVIFLRRYSRLEGTNAADSLIALVAILMQPATILVDHAHFQYNTVMLGFVLASLSSAYAGNLLWACVFFVAALGFKQMALYYSPVIFAYLLGVSVTPRLRIGRFLGIAIVTAISFALLFAPLLLGAAYDRYRGIPLQLPAPTLLGSLPFDITEDSWLYPLLLQMTQAIHRIFPFARGLFEDKVANVWCAIHTFCKLNRIPPVLLQRASLYSTFLVILAPSMVIGGVPRKNLLPLALASTAWGFFLCSFQVHEKSILLPLLPMTLLLGGEGGLSKETRAWVGWANMLGVWTLFPLLKRDELRVPYFVFTILWAYLLGLPPTSLDIYFNRQEDNKGNVHWLTGVLHLGFYTAMIVWHFLEAFVAPPSGKPDIWVVINVLIGAAGFGICYLWCTWKLILQSGLLGDYFTYQEGRQHSVKDSGKKKTA